MKKVKVVENLKKRRVKRQSKFLPQPWKRMCTKNWRILNPVQGCTRSYFSNIELTSSSTQEIHNSRLDGLVFLEEKGSGWSYKLCLMIANFAFSQMQKNARCAKKLAPISSEYCIMRAQWSSDDKLRVEEQTCLVARFILHLAVYLTRSAYTTLWRVE